MNRAGLLIVLIFGGLAGLAQPIFEKDYRFLIHLESISAYEEGVIFLENIKSLYGADDPGQNDTIEYYQGKFEYLNKNRLLSISHFQKVSRANARYWNTAKFCSGIQFAYLGNYAQARKEVYGVTPSTPLVDELKKLELAGLALLSRDYTSYQRFSENFNTQYFQLNDHQVILNKTYDEMISRKAKSPFVAGIMSALIPGAGRYYLGKFGQGTMSLITMGIFALQTYEGYRKGGLTSPTFITFGSLLSLFYVANIWGSVLAVRVDEMSFNDTKDETILLHMHIPVRLLFK